MNYLLIGAIICCLIPFASYSQDQQTDQTTDKVLGFPSKLLGKIQHKTADLDQQLTKQTVKYLQKLSRLENRLIHQLKQTDSNAANRLSTGNYQQWISQIQNNALPVSATPTSYVAHLDSLQTTLKFLQAQPGGLQGANVQLSQAYGQVQQLQAHFDQSTLISQYISQRRQQIAQVLSQYTNLPPGAAQAFNQMKATAYYYRQQIEAYKNMMNDPGQIEQKAIGLLSKMPAYQQFMARNTMLASLFRLPSDYGDPASLQGLQTKAQLQKMIQQQVGGGGAAGQSGVDQQMQQAQSQLSNMQNNLSKYGVGGQDLDMPNFQPNRQKTKTFLNRLTYGFSLQLSKASNYFPATGELGLSVGYKINDKSTIGLGAAYNIGLGSDWGHMQFSSQGLGLRSYMDWKIKKTYYVTAGYELNYISQFSSIAQLKNYSFWQPSALIGLEKKYKISSKLQGNIQLLFDALYRQEIPAGQMFRFRIGYNF